MSKMTRNISIIHEELDKISGLDGIAADKVEELARQTKNIVTDILENHSEASLANYYGNNKSEIDNLMEQIHKEPVLDEVVSEGTTLVCESYDKKVHKVVKIIEYKNRIYFVKYEDGYCVSFKKLR